MKNTLNSKQKEFMEKMASDTERHEILSNCYEIFGRGHQKWMLIEILLSNILHVLNEGEFLKVNMKKFNSIQEAKKRADIFVRKVEGSTLPGSWKYICKSFGSRVSKYALYRHEMAHFLMIEASEVPMWVPFYRHEPSFWDAEVDEDTDIGTFISNWAYSQKNRRNIQCLLMYYTQHSILHNFGNWVLENLRRIQNSEVFFVDDDTIYYFLPHTHLCIFDWKLPHFIMIGKDLLFKEEND